MFNVEFMPYEKKVQVSKGQNLLDLMRQEGFFIDAPCNGNGSCGKCKIKILKGNVESKNTHHIDLHEQEEGYVLACESYVIDDIVIEIEDSKKTLNTMKIEGLNSSKEKEIFERAKNQIFDNNMKFKTYVEKIYLDLEKPNLDDNISDWDRIKRTLRNEYGYDKVFCRLSLLKRLPKILREADFKITLTHIPRGENRTTIVNVELGDTKERLYGIALDIGTTSVAACLVDLYKGELISKASLGNAQIQYGADVINRIIFSTKKDGLEKLNNAIIKDTINPILRKMYIDAGVQKDEVIAFVASGNTTMNHLFLGVYPDYLRMEPYIPTFLKAPFIKASELELELNPETFIYLSPCISSYVGGDITSGILASGIWARDENVLFIDLGTNGEIVFGNNQYLMTCACSAGPAFEGGEISCGMRASNGAIDKVEIDINTLNPKITVIGDDKAKGICGSGIIDLISEMFVSGILDRRGKIKRNLSSDRIMIDEHDIASYILCFEDEYNAEKNISINEVDIDNFIRAKGAVYSGANVLINSIGMDVSMIDKVYIAGGIGSSLNFENAIKIGLLPDIDREKYLYLGNSSLMGSYLTLMSEDARHKLEEISSMMTYIELSVYPSYMDEFISACFLPHTNIDNFPSMKKICGE